MWGPQLEGYETLGDPHCQDSGEKLVYHLLQTRRHCLVDLLRTPMPKNALLLAILIENVLTQRSPPHEIPNGLPSLGLDSDCLEEDLVLLMCSSKKQACNIPSLWTAIRARACFYGGEMSMRLSVRESLTVNGSKNHLTGYLGGLIGSVVFESALALEVLQGTRGCG
ncbi:hypothetical protein PAAG_02660 [Paracoccidioides lutzii Pb01]|uniref:Uncharacterized protein n=1 Tax=Paracoccidioides lutzii (strain ATCC MYA-826 / Pb01) TaxID=502779 RepID=C1GVW5_PARBA|nr:hypothetical protein PAAG_02660 [Paracoccidioides lutzii Pb01]EEH40684.2 hypothetical protein PAAG_02660 [Paracoccidioides lutzii Pb01]